MKNLVACPFCREMFQRDEAKTCPICGVGLMAIAKLPPSAAESDDAEAQPLPPHMEELGWMYLGRGRGLLVALALAGLAMFFCPWIVERAPEIRTLSGFDLARRLGWIWASGIAWFVMLPLVLTRRSIYKMRGARVAIAFLAAIVATTVGVRLAVTPSSSILRPVRFEWGFGIYATGALALLALLASVRFGGRLDDVPTARARSGDETLH